MTMRVLRHYQDVPAEMKRSVVAIGNFDGVHRGHQAVIGEARSRADGDAPLAVLTFEPHPRELFQPDPPPFRLTPFRAKAIQMAEQGVDLLVAVHFDPEFAAKTAEAFIQEVLVDGFDARHVVTGYDFVFGKGRGGDAGVLQRAAGELGFGFTQVPALRQADKTGGTPGDIYKSTTVRDHLRGGRPFEAARQLGRWWEIDARVQHGAKRGHQIGFPTANMTLDEYLRPALGVYAVRVAILSEAHGETHGETHGEAHEWGEATDAALQWLPGVANLGRRPTIDDGEEERLEVFLKDFDGDLYGRQLRVALVDYIRPEQKFDGLDALKAQIAKDCETAWRSLDRAAEVDFSAN